MKLILKISSSDLIFQKRFFFQNMHLLKKSIFTLIYKNDRYHLVTSGPTPIGQPKRAKIVLP